MSSKLNFLNQPVSEKAVFFLENSGLLENSNFQEVEICMQKDSHTQRRKTHLGITIATSSRAAQW
jgi:hypothetical protein